MSSPIASPKPLEDYIAETRIILAKTKTETAAMDELLEARIKSSEDIINRVEENNELRKHGEMPDRSESEDRISIQALPRTWINLHAKVTHPQNIAFLDEIRRLEARHAGPAASDLLRKLQEIPLGDRDRALSVHCEKRLNTLMAHMRSFEVRNLDGTIDTHFYTPYRPDDKMLCQYIASKKEAIQDINQYFSRAEGRTPENDKRACRKLLEMNDDISAVLASVHSTTSGIVLEAIDNYRNKGSDFQADLISKAFFAVPLQERDKVLTGPSLVKNALATQEDGSIRLDGYDSGLIDSPEAPYPYRFATRQLKKDRGENNLLANEPGLVKTSWNTCKRVGEVAPAARPLDEPIVSPVASAGAGSLARPDDVESASISADDSVEDTPPVVTPPNITREFRDRLTTAKESDDVHVLLRSRHAKDMTLEDYEEEEDHPSDSGPKHQG